MTRVVNGIYDDAELRTGFFIPDDKVDILCNWMKSYADALEKAWERNGSQGNPRSQKHMKVRSFIEAVEKGRNAV